MKKKQTARAKALEAARIALAAANEHPPARRTRDSRAEQILKAVDEQRGRLGVVVSLLRCLTIALEYGGRDIPSGPHWCEVSQLAANMVRKVNDSLDSVNLDPS